MWIPFDTLEELQRLLRSCQVHKSAGGKDVDRVRAFVSSLDDWAPLPVAPGEWCTTTTTPINPPPPEYILYRWNERTLQAILKRDVTSVQAVRARRHAPGILHPPPGELSLVTCEMDTDGEAGLSSVKVKVPPDQAGRVLAQLPFTDSQRAELLAELEPRPGNEESPDPCEQPEPEPKPYPPIGDDPDNGPGPQPV